MLRRLGKIYFKRRRIKDSTFQSRGNGRLVDLCNRCRVESYLCKDSRIWSRTRRLLNYPCNMDIHIEDTTSRTSSLVQSRPCTKLRCPHRIHFASRTAFNFVWLARETGNYPLLQLPSLKFFLLSFSLVNQFILE